MHKIAPVLKNRNLMIACGVVVIAVIAAIFVPLLYTNSAILGFYANGADDNFVSNKQIVKSPDFAKQVEIKVVKADLFNPTYAVFYKAERYKNLDNAVVGDFVYLRRKFLIGWEVTKYESAYEPYYENPEQSLDQTYDNLKNDILDGRIAHGVTPEDERKLNDGQVQPTLNPGDTINTVKSPDESQSIIIKAGKSYGENYLTLGDGKDLGITDVTQAVWSADNKYIIYSTGSFTKVLGELNPRGDIWVLDLQGNKKKILEVGELPNDVTLFSDGQIIVYGTKNKLGSIKLDGNENKTLFSFPLPQLNVEGFLLPEIKAVDSDYIYFSIPAQDFAKSSNMLQYRVGLKTGKVEQL